LRAVEDKKKTTLNLKWTKQAGKLQVDSE